MARSVTATVPDASFREDASAVEMEVMAATTTTAVTAAARPSVSSLPSNSRRADRMVNSLLYFAFRLVTASV
jgi:hypothetical protein